jgi:hypothetical protein
MAYKDHRWLTPDTAPPPAAEILAVYQTTRQFYQEVEGRVEYDRYCAWYRAVAEQHQRELQKMRCDFNLLGWFSGRR